MVRIHTFTVLQIVISFNCIGSGRCSSRHRLFKRLRYYRVRKTWKDSKSQVGAYRILSNAKAAADKNPGTFVFANDGTAIYPADSTAEPDYRVHTVVKGDTLWDIAVKYLGKGSRYTEIKKLNGLSSNVIYSGWKLKIPN